MFYAKIKQYFFIYIILFKNVKVLQCKENTYKHAQQDQ